MRAAQWTHHIHVAEAADLPACAAIVNDYLDEVPWLPRIKSRAEIAAMFTPGVLAERVILVADRAQGVSGYLSLATEGLVRRFYLLSGMRGRGTGAALMAEATVLHPAGLEPNVFVPNLYAQRFCAREGFVEEPEGRDNATEEGIRTLSLRWTGEKRG